jgi:hypothetical protein
MITCQCYHVNVIMLSGYRSVSDYRNNFQGCTWHQAGRIIRPFLYPVSGRIIDCPAGYPVRPDTGIFFLEKNLYLNPHSYQAVRIFSRMVNEPRKDEIRYMPQYATQYALCRVLRYVRDEKGGGLPPPSLPHLLLYVRIGDKGWRKGTGT